MRPPLPPETAYYLRQLFGGRFRLVSASVDPPKRLPPALTFKPSHFRYVPGSPGFLRTVAKAPAGTFQGLLWVTRGGSPHLALEGRGVWALTLPRYAKHFQRLWELRVPGDVRPVRFRAAHRNGVLRHQHILALAAERRAELRLDITIYPSGRVAYEPWVEIEGTGIPIPLLWDEAQRVVNLFRDFTASAFRGALKPTPETLLASPPPQAPAAVP